MSERIQHARDTFGPQLFKTFEGALNSFMEAECPQLGGLRTRQTLVGAIAELVHAQPEVATPHAIHARLLRIP